VRSMAIVVVAVVSIAVLVIVAAIFGLGFLVGDSR
jgi:hypothetical protein